MPSDLSNTSPLPPKLSFPLSFSVPHEKFITVHSSLNSSIFSPEKHMSQGSEEVAIRFIQITCVLWDTWNCNVQRACHPAVLTVNAESLPKQNEMPQSQVIMRVHPLNKLPMSPCFLSHTVPSWSSDWRCSSKTEPWKEMNDGKLAGLHYDRGCCREPKRSQKGSSGSRNTIYPWGKECLSQKLNGGY